MQIFIMRKISYYLGLKEMKKKNKQKEMSKGNNNKALKVVASCGDRTRNSKSVYFCFLLLVQNCCFHFKGKRFKRNQNHVNMFACVGVPSYSIKLTLGAKKNMFLAYIYIFAHNITTIHAQKYCYWLKIETIRKLGFLSVFFIY